MVVKWLCRLGCGRDVIVVGSFEVDREMGIFVKKEELRVIVLSSFLPVITVFLTATRKGSGLNDVDSLFIFGCRRRTVASRIMLFGLAWFRLSL